MRHSPQTLLALVIFIGLAITASHAAVTFSTDETAFNATTNDSVQFKQFSNGTSLANPFTCTNSGGGGIRVTESQALGNAVIAVVGSTVAFPTGELYVYSQHGSNITINFDHPIFGLGLEVESANELDGDFTITAYSGSTNNLQSLGQNTVHRTAGNHVTFLSVTDSTAEITTILLQDTPANYIMHGHFGLIVPINHPVLAIANTAPTCDLNWSTNATGFHVQYTTNLAAPNWLALVGGTTTNGAFIHQTVNPATLGSRANFRLSNTAP